VCVVCFVLFCCFVLIDTRASGPFGGGTIFGVHLGPCGIGFWVLGKKRRGTSRIGILHLLIGHPVVVSQSLLLAWAAAALQDDYQHHQKDEDQTPNRHVKGDLPVNFALLPLPFTAVGRVFGAVKGAIGTGAVVVLTPHTLVVVCATPTPQMGLTSRCV